MNILSDHFLSNATMKLINHNMFPTINKYFKCVNCSQKFKSKSELSIHLRFFKSINSMNTKPQKYYCITFKKYYICLSFVQH